LLRESLRIRQRQAFVHAHYDRVTRFGNRQSAWTRNAETPAAARVDGAALSPPDSASASATW
jgi:hypothetical protein